MPLPLIPLIIGGAAALAGAGGVGAGIHGAVKMKDAKTPWSLRIEDIEEMFRDLRNKTKQQLLPWMNWEKLNWKF